ncbi:MAG: MogA/MoaB family molybdenum cofactor biosynthesis protein [Deltaproteobacteria bacterium]|nr:MAG: MogA/MoaB family molybdenum cofactor biosynthesis protein [Deltaproteobacteria bacterium]
MSVEEHKKEAAQSVACAVLTISDTRTLDDDASGEEIRKWLEDAGHRVAARRIIPDDVERISGALRALANDVTIDAVITSGGTGIAPRDNTHDVLEQLLTRRLDGFGELFRAISYEKIGSAAMLSRAIGGLIGTTVVFSLPGSPDACRLAMEKLIVPELGHLVALAHPNKWRR